MALYIALDKNGNPTFANDAITGEDYYCPCCGATIHSRKCIARKSHFFLFGDKHKSRDCGELENDKVTMRNPELMDLDSFAASVMKPKSSKGPGGGGSSGGHKPSEHKEMLPPNCIRQLIVCGVRAMNPQSPIKGGILSDIYVGPKAYEQNIVEGKDFGFRVMDLWLDHATDNCICYVAVWEYKNCRYRSFFEHRVSPNLNFEEIADELFQERRRYFGKTLWVKPRYRTVAVAGFWKAIERSVCSASCNLCTKAQRKCRGRWVAPLEQLGQIYYSDLDNNKF